MIKIFGIKNCDTMAKAFKWLDEHDLSYHFHNYKTDGIDKTTMENWLKTKALNEIINTKSTTFKSLSDEEKEQILDTKKYFSVVSQNTSVIKRPILIYKNKVLVGFNVSDYEKLLLKK
jgi:Spx/MgsR family transcriptional regulator